MRLILGARTSLDLLLGRMGVDTVEELLAFNALPHDERMTRIKQRSAELEEGASWTTRSV